MINKYPAKIIYEMIQKELIERIVHYTETNTLPRLRIFREAYEGITSTEWQKWNNEINYVETILTQIKTEILCQTTQQDTTLEAE